MDGWVDGWSGGWMVGRIDRWMVELADGRMDGLWSVKRVFHFIISLPFLLLHGGGCEADESVEASHLLVRWVAALRLATSLVKSAEYSHRFDGSYRLWLDDAWLLDLGCSNTLESRRRPCQLLRVKYQSEFPRNLPPSPGIESSRKLSEKICFSMFVSSYLTLDKTISFSQTYNLVWNS